MWYLFYYTECPFSTTNFTALRHCRLTLYKYYIPYGMTWQIVTPRKHCRPRWNRSWQCFSRGDDLPCHPVKNVIFYFIIPNVPLSYTTSILCYQVTLRTGQHFHWMSPIAMTLLRIPGRPPLVSQFEPYAHKSHACDIFLNVTLPTIAIVKTVWH